MRSLVRDVWDRWRGSSPHGDPAEVAEQTDGGAPGTSVVSGLRPRRSQDLGACARLLHVVHLEDGYPVEWPDSPRGWLDPPGLIAAFVVDRQREILGHAAAIPVGTDRATALHWRELTGLETDEVGVVARLFVRRRVRGTGLGGALLDSAAESVRARGLTPVLDAVAPSAAPLPLFTEHGWRLLASYPWRGRDDLHQHFYRGPR